MKKKSISLVIAKINRMTIVTTIKALKTVTFFELVNLGTFSKNIPINITPPAYYLICIIHYRIVHSQISTILISTLFPILPLNLL